MHRHQRATTITKITIQSVATTITTWIAIAISYRETLTFHSAVMFIGKFRITSIFELCLIDYYRNKKQSPNIVKDTKIFPNDFF